MMKVNWNDKVCSHAGVCVKSLPNVFKIEDGKFVIDTTGASDEEIRKTVSSCPSGALTLES